MSQTGGAVLYGRVPAHSKRAGYRDERNGNNHWGMGWVRIRSAFWGTVRNASADNVHAAMTLPAKGLDQWPSCGDSVASRAGRPRSSALCPRVEAISKLPDAAQPSSSRKPRSKKLPAGA
ncbi:hypothetical protein TgHK011_003782 [Trichoderma gracile]|nr:hypothetical protein TgHK011_003782 [Trichoderma gracile]